MNCIKIIGAGIGGLTLGIALKQKGFEVKIYEAAKEIKVVGAGIILGCNAMQVYQKLGLDQKLAAKGNLLNKLSVTDHKLKNLSVLSLDYFVEKYQLANFAIHRADLHQVLLDQFDASEVIFGKRLKKVNQNKTEIEFTDGTKESFDILIGADGIHSVVRASIFGTDLEIRKAGQMCWRGVVEYQLPKEYKHEFREAWGLGARIGHGQINESQVYWFALINSNESPDTFQNKDWKKAFKDFDPLLFELINLTPNQNIHLGEMTDLELLTKWYQDNICLLGDAAHAMTPNMGQGAGQSIEDALALANMLAKYEGDHLQAFPAYQMYRKKKVDKIVNNSWRIGNISQLENPFVIGLRNAAMRITPAFIGRNALKETFAI